MKKKILNNALTIIFILALFIFILTLAISIPIYFRPFYYLQIKTLNMEASTGYSFQVIKQAYDEVLNYLTLGQEFGTGELKYSESGYSHFADCKFLFDLNIICLVVSFVIVLTLLILDRKRVIELKKYFHFEPYFYTAIIAIVVPSILAILCSIDFDKAFIVFHSIFFPGKTNWWFDPSTDEIINVMPEDFFMNCAILIAVALVIFSLTLLIISIVKRVKLNKIIKESTN